MNSISFLPLKRITDHHLTENSRPVVSIVCLTYQHRDYIAKAIDGFLMQETSFPVEILIHDDASTDGTSDIVRDYQTRYPKLIKATLQAENQYSKGINPGKCMREKASGEYISLCEGDDFWTHPDKLEKQVNYLRTHPHVVLSFHDVLSVDSSGCELNNSKINTLMGTSQPLLLRNYGMISCALIPTLSIVYRNLPMTIGPKGNNVTNADCYLFAMLARYGEMHNIGITMGVHRRHQGGIWTSLDLTGQTLAHLKTLSAIAWEIDLENCQSACCNLAGYSWANFWNCLRLHKGAGCIKFVQSYITSMICCMRCLHLGCRKVPTLIATEISIIGIPLRFIAGASLRNLKKLISCQ